jgi:hypothetical protein
VVRGGRRHHGLGLLRPALLPGGPADGTWAPWAATSSSRSTATSAGVGVEPARSRSGWTPTGSTTGLWPPWSGCPVRGITIQSSRRRDRLVGPGPGASTAHICLLTLCPTIKGGRLPLRIARSPRIREEVRPPKHISDRERTGSSLPRTENGPFGTKIGPSCTELPCPIQYRLGRFRSERPGFRYKGALFWSVTAQILGLPYV